MKLNDRGFFYANSNAGMGWTDRANREAFYHWRIIPRMLVDTNTRDLTSMSPSTGISKYLDFGIE